MGSNKILRWFMVALFFGAVFLVYTNELTGNYGDRIIGKLDMKSDAPVFYNNIYVFEKKVHAGENPLQNDMEMHPVGVNMAMNTHNMGVSLFCLPFQNNKQGLNIGLLISFILSGLGTVILCYRFVSNIWLAILVGFIFTFSPWKMMKLQDHMWFALTATLPFYIYHFIDVFKFREKRWTPTIVNYKKLIYCFLLGLVTALFEYYLTFFLIYFSLFYVVLRQYIQPWKFNYKKIKTWGIILIIVAGLSTLVSVLSAQGLDDKGAFYWGGDLLGYLLPVYKAWVQDILTSVGMEIPGYQENYFFLGFAFIAFSIGSLIIAKKQRLTPNEDIKTFAWLAIIFFLFSLPLLKVAGHFILFLPTAIAHYIPFFNNIRVISRIFVMFSLVFPLVVVWFYHNSAQFKYKNLIPILVLVALLFEFKAPKYEVIDATKTPKEVYALKEIKGNVVLPIPAGARDGFSQEGLNNSDILYFQTIFDKKIIGGYTARSISKVKELYLQDSIMKNVFDLSAQPNGKFVLPTKKQSEDFFKKFGIDIIFIDAKYRATSAEQYIMAIAKQNGYETVLDKEYLILARR